MKSVAVTGATGYIGSYVTQMLLLKNYKVKIIARNIQQSKSLIAIMPHQENITFFQASLEDPQENWNKAIEGCEYVIHIASPIEEKNEKVMVTQAVNGNLRVLQASTFNKVKRVVITSSACTAMNFMNIKKHSTEEDIVSEESLMGYPLSKVRAEKAAFTYYKEQKGHKFEMVILLPTMVLGPILYKMKPQSSLQYIYGFMNGSGAVLDWMMPHIDVRDVARAHVNAIELPGLDGHRYILHSKNMWMKEVRAVLDKEFKEYGINIGSIGIPKWVFSFISIFKKDVKMILKLFNYEYTVSNDLMKRDLNIKNLIPLEQSIRETGYSMIYYGLA